MCTQSLTSSLVRGPAHQAWEPAAQLTGAKLDRGVGGWRASPPTHQPLWPAYVGECACVAPVSVEERLLVRPEWSRQTVSPLSGWSGACGAASHRDV